MNKKVYLQPQIKCAPLSMESLLASLSGDKVIDKTGSDGNSSLEYGGSGTDTGAKEQFGSFDNWDSWE